MGVAPVRAMWLLAAALVAGVAAVVAGAAAQRPDKATETIAHLVKEANGLTSDAADARVARLHQMLRRYTDIAELSRVVAGPIWARMDGQQRERFVELYGEYVVRVIARRLLALRLESFVVLGERSIPPADTLVASRIAAKDGRPGVVQWRVRDGVRIVDVLLDGASMAALHRSDFAGMIAAGNGNISDFLARLEERLQQIRAGSEQR